ncbi:Ribosomal protein L34 [Penicillium taxi]|uniref:Ribosomal protein L34 n=1 Tax=Penicillium taxi TaxID=168475 RepID=UPI0025453C52|nr:Ribosomal protein L34 [Penicillium taxi]KAJ5907427.1 Ribosomal protein L34 [Penicillium taxi]
MRAPMNPSSPMNRASQFAPRIQVAPSSLLSSRPFSSILFSTPARQPIQTTQSLTSRLSSPTPTLSLFSQTQPEQARSFSASAALGAPRNTFNPSRRVQKRRHGFLSRNKTHNGRRIITRRRLKGRRNVSW